uniref:glucose-6-phosphate dehydrogenase n=1 Tax=Crenothrix sp. TaxID=3100433 RepID=UPI00374D1736
FYLRMDVSKPEYYVTLAEMLNARHADTVVMYVATAPGLFTTVCEQIAAAGLNSPKTRVVLEKPLGHDLASNRAINETVRRVLTENQVFRIDHYLGKPSVQNLFALRFGNALFEPLWRRENIANIQINIAEDLGVESRGAFYENTGALRDMVQNHALQLLCAIGMEPPINAHADAIRDEKLKVLRSLKPWTPETLRQHVIRGQYSAGTIAGQSVPGYRQETGVNPDSQTETFVALRCEIANWRWAGVPFYIRTGKRMPKRASEIAIQFKSVPPILFNANHDHPLEPNVLALSIQPNEGLSLRIATKLPGTKLRIFPVKMDFRYGSTFGEQSPEAYERLLLDVMAGDATLFMRRDAVESSWAWVDNILNIWASSRTRWIPEYSAGTWGPLEADRLIEADNRQWRLL